MQNNPSIDAQLVLVEQHLEAAGNCLNAGDAQALTLASEALQVTALGLVQIMRVSRISAPRSELNAKIGQLAQRLIALRENLLRRSALVDRALKVVMPTVRESTYLPSGPYGAGLRSSGTRTAVSA